MLLADARLKPCELKNTRNEVRQNFRKIILVLRQRRGQSHYLKGVCPTIKEGLPMKKNTEKKGFNFRERKKKEGKNCSTFPIIHSRKPLTSNHKMQVHKTPFIFRPKQNNSGAHGFPEWKQKKKANIRKIMQAINVAISRALNVKILCMTAAT